MLTAIASRTGISIAAAHLGAAIANAARVTVLTSDSRDMRLVPGGKHVEVITR